MSRHTRDQLMGVTLGGGSEADIGGVLRITPSTAFTPTMQGGPKANPSAVSISVVRISDQAVVFGPSTAGMVELTPNSGLYACTAIISPAALGQYSVVWNDGSGNFGSQDMFVVTNPTLPPTVDTNDETLPCTLWTSGAEILASCTSAQTAGITGTVLDDYAAIASKVLYELSGRRYPGLCNRSVRPCRLGCSCDWRGMAWYNASSPGLGLGWNGGWWWGAGGTSCGCGSTSEVKLPGYPIQSVDSVSVDGATVNPSAYRLDKRRFLVAQKDNTGTYTAWPTCQDMTLSDIPGIGRFVVSYTWGVAPPLLGRKAAVELGCELASSIFASGSCSLPSNTVTVTRQGVQINRATVNMWLTGGATGLVNVDTFLATYNPNRLRRRPAVYSPDIQKHARKLGT